MSDQCGKCELRNNIEGCLSEDCFQHDNWFTFELQNQISNLKCCGNCKFRTSVDMGDYIHENCSTNLLHSSSYCHRWQSDGMTRKDRE